MKIIITLGILLAGISFATNVSAQSWNKWPAGYPSNWGPSVTWPSYIAKVGPSHLNQTSAPQDFQGSFSYRIVHNKTGAEDTSPPWSSDFSPLGDSTWEGGLSYTKTVPAWKGFCYRVLVDIVEGEETWTLGYVSRSRSLSRYEIVDLMSPYFWDLQQPPGGGA